MFGIVVYNCRIEPNYFWDEMTFDEVNVLIDQYNKDYQNRWEMTRWNGYINVLCAGNNLKQPTDLIRFSWEINEDNVEVIEDIETVKERLIGLMNRDYKEINSNDLF